MLYYITYIIYEGQWSSDPDLLLSWQKKTWRLCPSPRIRKVTTSSTTAAILTKRMGYQQFPFLLEECQHLANAANLPKGVC